MQNFMKASLIVLMCVTTAVATLALTGSLTKGGRASADSPSARECRVQFRRDALGAGADLPVPPLTDSINGANVAIFPCAYKGMREEWVIVEYSGKELWIARSGILLIQFTR